jgi:ketosteroid isomerase-like protein
MDAMPRPRHNCESSDCDHETAHATFAESTTGYPLEPVIFNCRLENCMCGIKSVAAAASFAALSAGFISQTSSATTPIADATRTQIEHTLQALERALVRGDGATALSKMLYAENNLIAGEGEDGSTRGMDATIKDYQAWIDSLGPGGTKGCNYTIVDPVVASATTFSSFLQLHCKANPPALPQDKDWRLMYVWKKQPEGWRVVLEMYVSGKL